MDSPFRTNRWNFPSSATGIRAQPKATPSRKVVSIPVHFVGSERSRSDSALKIQKVFRGFLVRKSVRKIAALRSEVDEIEKKISEKETVEKLRSDPKERLRVNETLMSLLFRLDSVRGVYPTVRDCRKAVIKRAIASQEMVDAIVSGQQIPGTVDEASEAETVHLNLDIPEVADDELRGKAPEIDSAACDLVENRGNLSANRETLDGLENNVADLVPDSVEPERIHGGESMPNSGVTNAEPDENLKFQALDQAIENSEKVDSVGADVAGAEIESRDEEMFEDHHVAPSLNDCAEESVGTSQTESESGSSANPETLIEGVEENPSKQAVQVETLGKEVGAGEDCGGLGGREGEQKEQGAPGEDDGG
ncbi:BAG family molecular chaperone regulator 5, mitochondrial [Morella rubra]|uniref:BAG family molecular chaperone regulator 5, mitochondrial n=1 Tax=Morella rubra TaxID=262757 RepID=A0A6A1UML3_9ROSI|nr:BAG family molecular chaperone regulator 5, mitochondrial [Morella rubra]